MIVTTSARQRSVKVGPTGTDRAEKFGRLTLTENRPTGSVRLYLDTVTRNALRRRLYCWCVDAEFGDRTFATTGKRGFVRLLRSPRRRWRTIRKNRHSDHPKSEPCACKLSRNPLMPIPGGFVCTVNLKRAQFQPASSSTGGGVSRFVDTSVGYVRFCRRAVHRHEAHYLRSRAPLTPPIPRITSNYNGSAIVAVRTTPNFITGTTVRTFTHFW